VFLAHTWTYDDDGRNNHERVSRINKSLQKRGFRTWFDEEQINDQIRQKMTEGVENSACFIVCITRAYQEKVNSADMLDSCYFEFDLASRIRSNSRIPVIMECSMKSDSTRTGRLNAEVGGYLFIDLSSDDEMIFESQCDKLADTINQTLGRNERKKLVENTVV
jgi:hypothetical protein